METKLNSLQIQELVADKAHEFGFNAPYGILESKGVSKSGKKYLSVTFGRPRTLDCEVQIYNRHFIVVRSSRNQYGSDVFKSVDDVIRRMETL